MPKKVQEFQLQKSGQKSRSVAQLHNEIMRISGNDGGHLLRYYFQNNKKGKITFDTSLLHSLEKFYDYGTLVDQIKLHHAFASKNDKAKWLSLLSTNLKPSTLKNLGFNFSKSQLKRSRTIQKSMHSIMNDKMQDSEKSLQNDNLETTDKTLKSVESGNVSIVHTKMQNHKRSAYQRERLQKLLCPEVGRCSLPTKVVDLITEFANENSIPAANRTIKGNGQIIPVRYVKCCIKCLFSDFKLKYKGLNLINCFFNAYHYFSFNLYRCKSVRIII